MPRIEIAAKRAQTGGPIVAAAAVNPSAVAPGFATQFCDVEGPIRTPAIRTFRKEPPCQEIPTTSPSVSLMLVDDALGERARVRRPLNAGASCGC